MFIYPLILTLPMNNAEARRIIKGLRESIAADSNPSNKKQLEKSIQKYESHTVLRLSEDEISELETTIKRLEQKAGMPIEMELRYNDGKEEVYGAFYDRPFEVVALPTDDAAVKRDLEILQGNYKSQEELEQKIKKLSICDGSMWGVAFKLLIEKYGAEELSIDIANRPGEKSKYTVPKGMSAIRFTPFEMLKDEEPEMYNEMLKVLDENNITYLRSKLRLSFEQTAIYLVDLFEDERERIADIHFKML